MSLLKKASIITTPTAYAEDYLYSIKPAIPFGEELITNLDFTSGWVTFGSVTVNNSNTFTSSAAGGIRLDGLFISGKTYTATIVGTTGATLDIKNYSGSSSYGSTSGTFNYTFTFQAVGTGIYLRNSSAAATTINSLSIKEVTDADFDFDRNSTGTRVNEDYLIEDVPYNLVLQSNQFNTSWTLFQGGTVTGGQPDKDYGNNAWKLNAVSTQAFSGLYQTKTFTGVTTASIFAKAGTLSHLGIVNLGGSGFAVWFNLSNGTIGTKDASVSNANMQNLGDGWYRCSFTQNVSAAGFFQFKPSDGELTPSTTSGFIYIQDAQLVKGDQPKDYLKTTDRLDIPRIDYTNGEPSILLEPQRQNVILNSTAISLSPTKNGTFVDNFAISPEGIQNATKITATNTDPFFYQSVSFSAGDYTASIYVKGIGQSIGKEFRFAISNQTHTANKYIIPSEWTRFEFTGTITTSTATAGVEIIDPAVVGDEILVWGWQVEAGSYATSLIHTSGTAVTRSQDFLPNPLGAVSTPTGNKAVIYLEIASTETISRNFVGFINGTSNQYGLYHWGTADNNKFGFNSWNGDSYGITGADYLVNGEFNKIAGLFDFTDFTNNKLYINGKQQNISQVRGTTLQRGAAPLGITTPNINVSTAEVPIGNYKSVMMFDQELTDEELEKLTGYNNHELYMNYYNRLSYLGLVEEYNVESDINNYIL